MILRHTLILVGCLLLASTALAQVKVVQPTTPAVRSEPQIPTIKLTLHPAAEVSPALKYRLIPAIWERKPGNAAPFYYRAQLLINQHQGRQSLEKEYAEKHDEWHKADDEKSIAEAKAWLAKWPRTAAGELREAVYREECDFNYRLRERRGIDLISFLLPEIQEMRTLGRHQSLAARIAIREHRFDDALESLRTGYAISKDTASEPLIINALVGIAVASMMNGEVEQWIGAPDSPNLYWALASLPQPIVDMRKSLEQEVRLPETLFPFLDDVETADHTPEEWQRILRRTVKDVNQNLAPLMGGESSEKVVAELAATALMIRAYPIAKAELKKAGYDEAKLEKMPVAQVIGIQMKRAARYVGDEFAKGMYLPGREREEYYSKLDKRLIAEGYLGPGAPREPIPLASLLMPAVSAALKAQTRMERDFAALRALEAIRAHLAATGELPEKLEDIQVLYVPKNPFTGEPFPYRREGKKATLDLPTLEGMSPHYSKRYELTVE